MKLLSLYMFHRIIFLLLIVSSLSWNFNRCYVCFQSFINIACRSTQNDVRIKRFWRFHIVIKPLHNKINMIKSLLCWSVTLLMFTQTLHSLQPAARIGDFEFFFSGFPKSALVLRSSWILNECNLYFKIVKYCILSEVCMIKTAPHGTVSP